MARGAVRLTALQREGTRLYLNAFSQDLEPLDMTALEEFQSLTQSAGELGIAIPSQVRYVSRNTVIRHQRFHFLEWGQPSLPQVVLLHGGNQSAHAWDLVSLNLCGGNHVLALDQRGHGDSEWSRGAHYGIDEMMQDALAFLGAGGARRPVVVGHSMGGMVALALAHRHPQALGGLVVVDIGPEVNERGTRMIQDFVGKNVEFDDLEDFLDRVERYDPYRSRVHIERTVKYNLLRRADGRYVSKNDRRRFARPDAGHGGQSSGRLPGAPALAELSRLDLPVLIVRGGDSNVLEQEAAERFAAAVPGAELIVVPGCGHNVASQNTLGFLAALKPFLERVTGG
jgi:pimeloyl-ACP methyl ester carboxylesterase